MNLGELKAKFENIDPNTTLTYGIGEPFSWRGVYAEVAFPIVKNITVKECLENINKALTETFYGYKGGEFTYEEYTNVNFENSGSYWTDGEYTLEMIALIECSPVYVDNEEKLIGLMLKS